jgi:undecaprenyl-diphosphatase
VDLLQAIILGIVEGITEFLPISSTGHLILTSNLLGIQQTEFVKTYEIAIQSGAILSVVVLYSNRMRGSFELGKRVLAAFIPTAILGFLMYGIIKEYLLGNEIVVVCALFLGGIALIGIELLFKFQAKYRAHKNDNPALNEQISYGKALTIGLFQSIAFVPGVSRAAATIVGAMLLGVSRQKATEFSFLLAVPTMLSATALDIKETRLDFSSYELVLLAAGFVTSFFVATIAVKWLVNYVRGNDFIPFGIYRIALALLYFLLVLK